jgi:HTH-type transcriptional regulator/antitoxin HigA
VQNSSLELIDALTRKQDRSAEEAKLLNLLVRLVEDFEEQHYQLKRATPGQILQELLSARGMTDNDIAPDSRT